jgi:hypothetical protein
VWERGRRTALKNAGKEEFSLTVGRLTVGGESHFQEVTGKP